MFWTRGGGRVSGLDCGIAARGWGGNAKRKRERETHHLEFSTMAGNRLWSMRMCLCFSHRREKRSWDWTFCFDFVVDMFVCLYVYIDIDIYKYMYKILIIHNPDTRRVLSQMDR